jgi:acyl-CoA synthetase (AMP-forming)/AMP-acid ligase II
MKIGYYQGKNKKNNVVSFLEEHAEQQPDKVAFYFLPKAYAQSGDFIHDSITYRDFNDKTGGLAGGLSEFGIKKNDRVLIFIPISPELYISIAALQRLGAIPVLLDSWSRQEQLAAIVRNSKPRGIIALAAWLQAYEGHLNSFGIGIRISVDENYDSTKIFGFPNLFSEKSEKIMPVEQNHTALITYTTGSSGVPKGANRTHHFLAAQHYALKRLFPYQQTDIDLPVFPVFALNNIASGITTVLPAIDISKPSLEDSKILLTQISKCKVNCMTLAPSSFRNLAIYCDTKEILLDSISRVLTGGAPVSETDIQRFVHIAPNSSNWILYGSTEVEPIAYVESKEMLSIKLPERTNATKVGVNVGKIDKTLRYKFINVETGNITQPVKIQDIDVGKGEIGELVVAGEHVCEGYYRNKEAFARTKIEDVSGTIWHRTGDLARIDSRGYLWIVGRKHNVIKRGSEYFFPVRPEILLKDLPNVTNAAYLDFENNGVRQIAAVVTLKKTDKNNQQECRKEISEIFEKEELPLDAVIFMEDIPMDVRHHSKVNYDALRQKLYEISV